MKIVVQRTSKASVFIDGKLHNSIETGFMILVGITHEDTKKDADLLAKKVALMRVFEDSDGKMNLALSDVNGQILSISQFTLYADCKKGNRPSFVEAAKPDKAKKLYDYFNFTLENEYNLTVKTGIFGADMKLDFINDGPVTIILDSEVLK